MVPQHMLTEFLVTANKLQGELGEIEKFIYLSVPPSASKLMIMSKTVPVNLTASLFG